MDDEISTPASKRLCRLLAAALLLGCIACSSSGSGFAANGSERSDRWAHGQHAAGSFTLWEHPTLELLRQRLGALAVLAAVSSVVWVVLMRRRFDAAAHSGECERAQSRRTDLVYMALAPVSELFSRALVTMVFITCACSFGHRVGPELFTGFGPISRQPYGWIMVEMLVAGDFIYYWVHRAAHTVPFLWRFHAVHHSTSHAHWGSAFRVHPAEVYAQLAAFVPLFALGFPVDALAPLAPFNVLYAMLIHSNLTVSFRGPWRYVLNSPVYHRWHHARGLKRPGRNFAGYFPLYDVLFGTCHESAELPRSLGLEDPRMPVTCLGQLRYAVQSRKRAKKHTAGAKDRAGTGLHVQERRRSADTPAHASNRHDMGASR